MEQTHKPWWMLVSGILALSIVYTAILLHRGTALAGPMFCPAEKHVCQGTDCDQKDCKDGTCPHHNRPA